jgi:hypothetical protein
VLEPGSSLLEVGGKVESPNGGMMETPLQSPAGSRVAFLQEMGFPFDRCQEALRRTGGQVRPREATA